MRLHSVALAAFVAVGLAGCSSSLQLLTVTSVTPSTLAAGSATTITLTGTQFTANMSVTLGTTTSTVALPTTFVSATTLTATVPNSVPGGSYTVLLQDNASALVARATLSTGVTLSITNPLPTLTSASPNVFVGGGSGAMTTVTGTNFVSGSTATIDGVARAVTVLDGTHLKVALTADDLLYATTRQLVVVNPAPAGGSSAAAGLTITDYTKAATKYAAYGDSITFGYGVTPQLMAYPYQLATANSLTIQDHGATGDQACDTLPKRLYPAGDEYTASKGQVYTYMIGTNETYVKGTGAYEAVYNTCHQAVLSWLALSRANKSIAGDKALVSTGGCGTVPDTTRSGALYCATAGTVSTTMTTAGSPIYVWYVVDDSAPATATLQVSIDGTSVATLPTQLTPAIATLNGSTQSIALLRLPAAAGTHAVVMTAASGSAGVLGIGSVPASRSALSFVVGADVPFQSTYGKASVATQVQYAADARANVALLQSDGLDIRFAPTRRYMLGTDAEMSNQLHPNLLGHTHLAAAFQTGFTGLNASSGVYASLVRNPALALDTGGENTLPDVPIATVQPGHDGTSYRMATSAATLVTVGNTSARAHAALLLAPDGEMIDGAPAGLTLPAGEVVTLTRDVRGERGVWTVVRTGAGVLTPARP